ncbi:hypothetical protein ACL02S_08155 [Nocardia sp. 004]|uniref:hypothetical protein n=1 Tax=Nocardia sp. 004 TaxID=3385978 RepID=UPI0039A09385
MADMFEFLISVDLRDELSAADVAELRWQLGSGAAPEDGFRIESGACFAIEGDDGEPVPLDPEPLLGLHGPAWKIGGMLHANLERSSAGWHLEARQELHAETLQEMTELMLWLYRRVDLGMVGPDGSVELGRLRWHEDAESTPLMVSDAHVPWPQQPDGSISYPAVTCWRTSYLPLCLYLHFSGRLHETPVALSVTVSGSRELRM